MKPFDIFLGLLILVVTSILYVQGLLNQGIAIFIAMFLAGIAIAVATWKSGGKGS